MSVAPSSVSGAETDFRLEYHGAPAPSSPVRFAELLIGASINDKSGSCWITYDVDDRKLWLTDDTGTKRLGPLEPGIAKSVANSQCSVSDLQGLDLSSYNIVLQVRVARRLSWNGSHVMWMSLTPWAGSAVPFTDAGVWSDSVTTQQISVSIAPLSATMSAGQTRQFMATVTGAVDTAVRWTATQGTISASGLYTAPPVTAETVATVIATSVIDPAKRASATVTLLPPNLLSITPATATLTPSGTQQFSATLPAASTTGVTWSLSAPIGSISSNGLSAVYTAPAIVDQTKTVDVIVRTVADPTKMAKALLTLIPLVSISASPALAEVKAGATQQFTAAVTGTSNTAVEWSLSPALGTISQTGLYTAPASLQTGQEISIIATALADKTKKAIVKARLTTGQNLTFRLGTDGLESLVYRGIEYNYKYGENLVSYLSFKTPQGTVRAAPTCTRNLVGNKVIQDCVLGGRQVSVTATYTPCPNDGICAEMQITNKSAELMTEAFLSTFGISTTQYNARASGPFPVSANEPAGVFDLIAARAGIWIDTPGPGMHIETRCGYSTICKNHLTLYYGIRPGETTTRRYCMRFTADSSLSRLQLMPEAYASYRAANPPVINWPDRRPIMMWWLADTGRTSAVNPRGYMQDPALNVSSASEFRKRVMDRAGWLLTQMNSQPARPQGIILWDIEGQEFIHPTTYIGDPRAFGSGYAPEMNAITDELFGTFRNAGYRVGVTLRPQYMQWGTTLPATCKSDPYNGWRDYFIKTNAPYKQAFYGCYGGWAVIQDGNGWQTELKKGQENEILNLLRSKATYARNRWGVTIFYVDSAVYTGGGPIDPGIFRALQQEFPDCLFIPEQESIGTLAAAIPFTDVKSPGDAKLSPLTWRWAYPNAAMAVKWNDCTDACWNTYQWEFKASQKTGDIALMSLYPQTSLTHLANMMATIIDVRKDMSNVFVTDSVTGRKLTFSGTPAQIRAYPVKLRVYFAASAAQLPGSTVQCEAGQWLGENSCTLDLSGMTVSQIRYYDFAGNHVKTEAAQPLN